MHSPIVAIIGAGHLGTSLLQGLLNHGHSPDKLWATNRSLEKLSTLKASGIHTTTDNRAAANAADIVLFAVKPASLGQAIIPLREILQQRKPLVISVAAGIREASIQHWLGGEMAIIRAMPNTPALINAGATALFANTLTNAEQRNAAESILRSVGLVTWLDNEDLMDVATVLSGSGPAYFFLQMEILQEIAESFGLPSETARLLTTQTALGAARMAMGSNTPLTKLRRHVTSPGGTTEKAISFLEENHIRSLFKNALSAAKQHAEQMATILGGKE